MTKYFIYNKRGIFMGVAKGNNPQHAAEEYAASTSHVEAGDILILIDCDGDPRTMVHTFCIKIPPRVVVEPLA